MTRRRFYAPPGAFEGGGASVVLSEEESRHLMVAYDDLYSIEHMGQKLRPWWRRNGEAAVIDDLHKCDEVIEVQHVMLDRSDSWTMRL